MCVGVVIGDLVPNYKIWNVCIYSHTVDVLLQFTDPASTASPDGHYQTTTKGRTRGRRT